MPVWIFRAGCNSRESFFSEFSIKKLECDLVFHSLSNTSPFSAVAVPGSSHSDDGATGLSNNKSSSTRPVLASQVLVLTGIHRYIHGEQAERSELLMKEMIR